MKFNFYSRFLKASFFNYKVQDILFLIFLSFCISFSLVFSAKTSIKTANPLSDISVTWVQDTAIIGKIIPQKDISEPAITDFRTLLFGDLIYDRWVYRRLENITWLITHFKFRYEPTVIYQGIKTSFKQIANRSDFVWLNLETPIGRFWSGEKEISICQNTHKTIAFCSHEDILPVIKSMWFTMVNLANNHSLDAGIPAHLKTIELLHKYGIKYFGYIRQGKYFEKNYVYTGEKNWQKFAWHGYDYSVYNFLNTKYCEDLKLYKKEGYVNFVVVHRWPEYVDNHTIYQENIAKQLLQCGADTIFWGHPHVLQDTQIYTGKVVLYSLGNFLFDQDLYAKTKIGGYVLFDYDFTTSEFSLQTGTFNALAVKKE